MECSIHQCFHVNTKKKTHKSHHSDVWRTLVEAFGCCSARTRTEDGTDGSVKLRCVRFADKSISRFIGEEQEKKRRKGKIAALRTSAICLVLLTCAASAVGRGGGRTFVSVREQIVRNHTAICPGPLIFTWLSKHVRSVCAAPG